jgi:hypothetical protein
MLIPLFKAALLVISIFFFQNLLATTLSSIIISLVLLLWTFIWTYKYGLHPANFEWVNTFKIFTYFVAMWSGASVVISVVQHWQVGGEVSLVLLGIVVGGVIGILHNCMTQTIVNSFF